MKLLHEETLRVNSGGAWELRKGQRIRINFESIMDFIVFNLNNVTERFDQARTKSNQGKIYISTGDKLYSKLNHVMMTVVEDTYKGHHDLQYGMCSKTTYDLWWENRTAPQFREWFGERGIQKREDLPMWGCYENLMNALQNYPIIPLDLPAPFNIAQSEDVDPKTGQLIHVWQTRDIPEPGTHIDLRAEMDVLCAGSVGPGQGKLGYAKPMLIQVFDE
jgi:uncharacterized protein